MTNSVDDKDAKSPGPEQTASETRGIARRELLGRRTYLEPRIPVKYTDPLFLGELAPPGYPLVVHTELIVMGKHADAKLCRGLRGNFTMPVFVQL